MRRKEREITDAAAIREVIRACHCCRLGFWDGKEVYIVPLNFGYCEEDGSRIFYFHGAKEGRKVDLMKGGPSVGFELDTAYSLVESESACGYTAHYKSIIGTGRICVVEDVQEKRKGFSCIMHQNTGKADWDIPEAALASAAVYRLVADTLSCKAHG